MLRISDLNLRYGGIVALENVSIDVGRGETVLLIGSNGAGKSSLMKAVIGLVTPGAGRIELEGQDLTPLACAARARAGIGFSPEGRHVFPSLSVRENILSASMGMGWRATQANYRWLIDTLPILREREHQPANQLSGGQQQVVALARAVITMPKLLLLDEPFLGLAPVWIDTISEAVRQLQKRGTTILMTEQMARPALKLADRVYLMRNGEVRRSGAVADIGEVALAEEYL